MNSAPTRRPSAPAPFGSAAVATASTANTTIGRASGLRPSMVRTATAGSQRKPSRTAIHARKTTAMTASPPVVPAKDAHATRLGASSSSDAEQKVRAIVLAYLRKPDRNRLLSRERTLIADLTVVVQQLTSERDDARREVHNLRDRLSPAILTHGNEAMIDNDTADQLEDKPTPTMWQLIAADYADDPELAAAWTDLRDDPAFAELHEMNETSLTMQVRARLRNLQLN